MTSDLFEIVATYSRRQLGYALALPDEPPKEVVTYDLKAVFGRSAHSCSLPSSSDRPRAFLGSVAPKHAPPPWAVGFSKQFKNDTTALDRKIMGRILEVLEELSEYSPPFKPQGDTFKPLSGDLKGCWRYRVGDYRLLVKPNAEIARIDALAFAARGSVYS